MNCLFLSLFVISLLFGIWQWDWQKNALPGGAAVKIRHKALAVEGPRGSPSQRFGLSSGHHEQTKNASSVRELPGDSRVVGAMRRETMLQIFTKNEGALIT